MTNLFNKLEFGKAYKSGEKGSESTLDYPPRGLVEIGLSEEKIPETTESLSAEPENEDEDQSKRSSDGGKP